MEGRYFIVTSHGGTLYRIDSVTGITHRMSNDIWVKITESNVNS